jgi:hypothetical protein
MLEPRLLRRLTLERSRHPRHQPHLSSASGLALAGHHLYIVADDENHVAWLDARDPAASPLMLAPFAAATLPSEPLQRKAAKSDLESLIVFPAGSSSEDDLLVAWGSASRPQREFAYVFALDERGAIASAPRKVTLSGLCAPLHQRYGELNLEAGFVRGEHMHLFQRAHGGQPVNGHIRFDARAMRAWLCGQSENPPLPLEMKAIDLGCVAGVPLGITDAAASPEGGWVFSAVAEETTDAYTDGACVGSVIGRAGEDDQVHGLERLRGNPKVEGLAFAARDRLWLVTDADDPASASELLELRWRI